MHYRKSSSPGISPVRQIAGTVDYPGFFGQQIIFFENERAGHVDNPAYGANRDIPA
ncbi:hypothetical protein KKI24_13045 [bacterium]|nr:hypothetical protein [bacterium]